MITFGLNYVLIELALQVWGSDYVSLPYLQSTWAIGGVILSKALVTPECSLRALPLCFFGLTDTLFGKTLLAASQSPTGAVCCGIDVGRVRLMAFALGVGLASAAGALLILVIPMAAASADNLTILAFVIIALGGLGDYAGVVVAALLLGLAQSVVGSYLGGDAENVLPYALLILIMVARPQGFRRMRRLEKPSTGENDERPGIAGWARNLVRAKSQGLAHEVLIGVIIVVVAIAIPLTGSAYTIQLATDVLTFATLAYGWNLISGFTGYLSFGQSSFFGLGAYTHRHVGASRSCPVVFRNRSCRTRSGSRRRPSRADHATA